MPAGGCRAAVILLTLALARAAAAAPVTTDAVKADADKVAADLQRVQDDEQKCKDVLEPARMALHEAREKLRADAAPFDTQAAAEEQKWEQALRADQDAIETARLLGRAAVDLAEQRLRQDEQRARQNKSDKSAAAAIPQDQADVRAARQKLDDEVNALETKRAGEKGQRDQALEAGRAARKQALQPEEDAVREGEKAVQEARVWADKLAADRAALDADRKQLQLDQAALQQQP
jgi:chromosome segregation ATPase